jgi:hypothetical protein
MLVLREPFMPVKSKAAVQRYDVHPSLEMVREWIDTLKKKTGRTLVEWVAHIRTSGPAGEKARREWLKDSLGLPTNTAWWLAERAEQANDGPGEEDPEVYLEMAEAYVREQYAGKREELRPIYDGLYTLARSLAKDVRLCPCKTMVPVFRRHVIAQIKPATNTRVDLGLALGKYSKKLPARLIDTGGKEKKDRITHRIPLSSAAEIDEDVRKWMRVAYELDA